MDKFSSLLSAEVEKEVEYVYWVKVTPETLQQLIEQPKSVTYMDVLMNKVKARYRIYNESEVEYTKKTRNSDGSKTEHNHKNVPFELAHDATKYAENIHRVRRVLIPITEQGTGKPLLRKSTGEQLHWEIDVFYTTPKGNQAYEWVKVELEVDNFNTKTLQNLIPINYLDLIDEADKAPEDEAMIANIWNQKTNVLYFNKIK